MNLFASCSFNMRLQWNEVLLVLLLAVTQCRSKIVHNTSVFRSNNKYENDLQKLELSEQLPPYANQRTVFSSYMLEQVQRDRIMESIRFEDKIREHLGLTKNDDGEIERRMGQLRDIFSPDAMSRKRRNADGEDHLRHKSSKKYMTKLKQKQLKHFRVPKVEKEFGQSKTDNRKKVQSEPKVHRNKKQFKQLEKVKLEWQDALKSSRTILDQHKKTISAKHEKKHIKDLKMSKDLGIDSTNGMLRSKRAVVNSDYSGLSPHWGNLWWLGSTGEVALRMRTSGHMAVFRAEARATGHVALALGNDAVLAWLDNDGQPHILDCHLVGSIPMADYSQDYELVFGLSNHTHLVIEFKRPLDTCDPDDTIIGVDPIDVQWSLGEGDPRGTGWGGWKGTRPLQFLAPRPPPPPPPPPPSQGMMTRTGAGRETDYERWDVLMKDVVIPEKLATTFWCKVFKVPALASKHHIVGYTARAGPAARHMVLYECAPPPQELPAWERWATRPATIGPDVPRDWAACLTPVAAWAIGSKGEMFPSHVGIPLGDPNGVTYYMLEIHYENPSLQKVIDNSGMTILYTERLRQHDAGIMVTGITVSALHVLPAGQKTYNSAGYCSEPCTKEMLPDQGINVVSVLLHAHSAGRKLSLRHIRKDQELPKIAEDDQYDYKNQKPKILSEERNIQPGDALVTECAYDTSGRSRPTLGGYSAKQEMCLAFVLHYPRIPLAGCYSMTPVKEFFETFGVREFYKVDMKQVENLFLASGSLEGYPDLMDLTTDKSSKETGVQGDDQGVSLLGQLVIKEPTEFRNKTFIAHLNEIPWNEPLLTKRVEDILYKGKHMTFCRKRDDTIAVPIEIRIFPKFSELIEDPSKQCHYKSQHNGSLISSSNTLQSSYITFILSTFMFMMISSLASH